MRMMKMNKSYRELLSIDSFDDRLEYLKCGSVIGHPTFGGHRYLNQMLYHSDKWKKTRNDIIIRDEGCDMAHSDYPLFGDIIIHHINPINVDDIVNRSSCVFDPNNLVCVGFSTHNMIHFGIGTHSPSGLITRKPNDTCPWKG